MRIAAYGSNDSDREIMRLYMGRMNSCQNGGFTVAFYDSVDHLIWDIDVLGGFDVVVIYRSWQAARLIRLKYGEANMVMVSRGADEGIYDIQPCYLIYEPVDEKNFEKVMGAALRAAGDGIFTFQSGRTRYRLSLQDIMYFENDKRRINVLCEDRKYTYYGKMRDLEVRVGSMSSDFMRVHESYMVNSAYVREFYANRLVMKNGACIAISAGRRPVVREQYMGYMGARHI